MPINWSREPCRRVYLTNMRPICVDHYHHNRQSFCTSTTAGCLLSVCHCHTTTNLTKPLQSKQTSTTPRDRHDERPHCIWTTLTTHARPSTWCVCLRRCCFFMAGRPDDLLDVTVRPHGKHRLRGSIAHVSVFFSSDTHSEEIQENENKTCTVIWLLFFFFYSTQQVLLYDVVMMLMIMMNGNLCAQCWLYCHRTSGLKKRQ